MAGVFTRPAKKAATCALVKPLKLVDPLAPPYRLGKFAASHWPSVRLAAVGPNFLIRSWPSGPAHQLIPLVINCEKSGGEAATVVVAVELLLTEFGSLVPLLI